MVNIDQLYVLVCPFNSLAPGRFEWHIKYVIFILISMIDILGISCEIAVRWLSLDFADE